MISPQRTTLLYLVLGLLLILATRAPQLMSENRYLDGDEAVVGVMARHVAEGSAFPVFFYGQRYGLTAFESGLGGLAFRLFGPSDVALRVAMLALWCAGWMAMAGLLFARAAPSGRARAWSFLLSTLLVTCPAWFSWSMLARGGYVTAFVFSGLTLWLGDEIDRGRGSRLRWFALGASLAVTALAQATFALALAPLTIVLLARARRWSAWIAPAIGGLSVLTVAFLSSLGQTSSYWSPTPIDTVDLVTGLRELPWRAWTLFTGSFYYVARGDAGPITRVTALGWCIAIPAALVHLAIRGPRCALRLGAALGILLLLALSTLVGQGFHLRYLLPMAALGVLLVALAASTPPGRRSAWLGWPAMVLVLIGLGAISVIESRNHSRFNLPGRDAAWVAADIQPLVHELRANRVAHVYCLQPMLTWSIMFYSDETIRARWETAVGRRPEYTRAVDRALLSGAPVALAGSCAQTERLLAGARLAGYTGLRAHRAGQRLCWISGAGPELIKEIGYTLNE